MFSKDELAFLLDAMRCHKLTVEQMETLIPNIDTDPAYQTILGIRIKIKQELKRLAEAEVPKIHEPVKARK